MTKLDVKTTDPYRARRGQHRSLNVPAARYLMVDGHGDPNASDRLSAAIATLYPSPTP